MNEATERDDTPPRERSEAEKLDAFLRIEHERAGEVSTAEALEIAERYNNSHFRGRMPAGNEEARYSIPANPKRDDDIRLTAFIARAERAFRELARFEVPDGWETGFRRSGGDWDLQVFPVEGAPVWSWDVFVEDDTVGGGTAPSKEAAMQAAETCLADWKRDHGEIDE